jgi:uncharacterized protein (TIGR00369 family)
MNILAERMNAMLGLPLETILQMMKAAYEDKVPFNALLGIKIDSITSDTVVVRIDMKDDLVGNFEKKILSGGVISTVLDFTGGVIAQLQVVKEMMDSTPEELLKRLTGMGTIDMRIDFIRPGRGKYFLATGSILRLGKKVAVVRTEMSSDEGMLIAAGTGTYLAG